MSALPVNSHDPQVVAYDRLVTRGEPVDDFSAKLLYPGLTVAEARAKIARLAANAHLPTLPAGGAGEEGQET